MDKKLIEELKENLEAQKISIKKELEKFAVEDPKSEHNWDAKFPQREDSDTDEQADDVTEYDNALSLEHSFELKLKNVVNALEKIEKGTYGVCETCGKEISEERLKACPEARTCMKCGNK